MSSEILNPVTNPGLIYPQFPPLINKKITERRKLVTPRIEDFICVTCKGTNYSHIYAKKEDQFSIDFFFECAYCASTWKKEVDIPTYVLLNDVILDQIDRLGNMTEDLKVEFGALILRKEKDIVLDFFQHGIDKAIVLKLTRELKEDEEILGTCHIHPQTDEFSIWDCATFLAQDWERVSILLGAQKTINLFIKDENTKKLSSDEVEKWEQDNINKGSEVIAKENNIIYYKGKTDKLLCVNELSNLEKESTLEKLLKGIKGSKSLKIESKKGVE